MIKKYIIENLLPVMVGFIIALIYMVSIQMIEDFALKLVMILAKEAHK